MPRSAIGTGLVDYVLPLDRIGAKLVELLDHHADLTRQERRHDDDDPRSAPLLPLATCSRPYTRHGWSRSPPSLRLR